MTHKGWRVVKPQHIHSFFVFDNCDFQEDTVDGKNTLHVTVMNIYQRVDENDEAPNLAFNDQTEDCFIGNSGIDAAWLNADLYGQTTIKQIDGNHMKRGVKAHTVTLLSLFAMNVEAFSQQNAEFFEECMSGFSSFNESCSNVSPWQNIQRVWCRRTIHENLKLWNSPLPFHQGREPMLQVMLIYIRVVVVMLQLIRAVRNGDWEGHFNALIAFVNFFFFFFIFFLHLINWTTEEWFRSTCQKCMHWRTKLLHFGKGS